MPFSVFTPCLKTRPALLRRCLFVLSKKCSSSADAATVAVFFDVSRRDSSEFSPVSFHGSLKVDFESVSVKLGLIAATEATHSTHSRGGKRCVSRQSTQRLLLCGEERRFFITYEAV